MIHISLSPNLQSDDLLLSIKLLFKPQNWKTTTKQLILANQLVKMYKGSKAYLTNSGRSALLFGLTTLNLPKRSEIILQSFTCSAAVNPIISSGLVPKYIDIDLQNYNINPDKIKEQINQNTRAIVIQHTFGTPADVNKIKKIAQKHKLTLIEDCAHSLGASYKNKPVGSFGDISILSFGRDKVISSVFGGALIINNPKLFKSAEKIYSNLKYPSTKWTYQQLLHPIITSTSKMLYSTNVGKLILLSSQKLKLVSKALYPEEKYHKIPQIFPAKLPEPLAALALNQLKKLTSFNNHRAKIAKTYDKKITNPAVKKPSPNKHSIYLRYNILTQDAKSLLKYLKHNSVIAGDWYTQPITPSNNLKRAHYTQGSNKNTEYACTHSINLPTNPNTSILNAKEIAKLINQWKL